MAKQQTDNILQAPAEGFGQNITFAFRPDGSRGPQLDALGAVRGRADVEGAPTNGRLNAPVAVGPSPQRDPTVDVLMKLADTALAPRIKEAKAEAFVTGMQRAATGEAVKDIADGQPWYTRIFGDSDVVEGARQYSAQAAAADAAGAVEDSMKDVRQLDPQSAHTYYTKLISQHLTGDAATDASIMQAFSRTLPATMRRQAKEHYAWRQEQASEAESKAVMSNAALLQKRANADTQTTDEYVQNAVQFFASMTPAAGRDIDSWTKARTQDLLNLAQNGQFHAINAIKGSGLLDKLHPDQRTKIESAIDTAENRQIARSSLQYAPELGRIAGEAEVYHDGMSAQDSYQQLQALNERFRKETGIDRDLITLPQGEKVIKDVTTTILREGERRIKDAEHKAAELAKEQDKARAEQAKRDGALQAISVGNLAGARRAFGHSLADEQFYGQYDALRGAGPEAQAGLLALNYGAEHAVHEGIKNAFEARVGAAIGGQMPADFLSLHGQYAAMRAQSPILADAYFGKYAPRMALFDQLLDGKPGDSATAGAFVAAFGSTTPPHPKALTKAERSEATKALAEVAEPGIGPLVGMNPFRGGTPMRDDQQAQAMSALEPTIQNFKLIPGITTADAVRRGLAHNTRETGTELMGGFFVRGHGQGQQPLSSILREMRPGDSAKGTGEDAPDYWGKQFQGMLKARADRMGADYSAPIVVTRWEDKTVEYGGKRHPVAQMDVTFTGKDGRPVSTRFTSQDIKDFARSPGGRISSGVVTQ